MVLGLSDTYSGHPPALQPDRGNTCRPEETVLKKLVLDPSSSIPRPRTALIHFGLCKGAHLPMFALHPGADIEGALIHLSAALT